MKNKKRIVTFIFIMVATAFIVGASVSIGIGVSEYIKNNDNKAPKEENVKQEETTQDFKVEFREELYTLKDKDGKVIVENRRTIPNIISEKYQVQSEKISAYLIKISDEQWDKIKISSDEYYSQNSTEKVGVNYLLSVLEQNDKYFTFVYDMSGTIGGVNWDDRVGYSFNTQTGDLLSLNDISTNTNELINICYTKLLEYISNKEYANELDSTWKTRLNQLISENGVWYLTKDGLSFSLPKYSLGPGSIGVISYMISYEDLGNLILEDYKK